MFPLPHAAVVSGSVLHTGAAEERGPLFRSLVLVERGDAEGDTHTDTHIRMRVAVSSNKHRDRIK